MKGKWFRRQLAALSVAVVLGVAAAAASPVPAAAGATSTLDEIYASLRVTDLRTASGATTFDPGDEVRFQVELENTSATALVIPVDTSFGSPFHLVGGQQAWIERLGPNPTIPGIPPITGRKGTWYAMGGEIIALENLLENTIQPGQRITRDAVLYSVYTTSFPPGAYRYHIEYKPLFGDLFDVISTRSLTLSFGGPTSVDTTAPTLEVPDSVVVDATSEAGAAASFTATAVDDNDPSPSLTCEPPSGSAFPIGTTMVICIATDAAGNSASASFDVHVKGASEQLGDLGDNVEGVGPGTSLADKIHDAQAAVAAGEPAHACELLSAFSSQVRAQTGRSLAENLAAELITSSARIRSVLGC